MHPVELVRGFFTDLIHLPFLFQLGLLYMAGAMGWQWRKQRKQRELISASETWPVYRARVVWAQVSDRKSEGRHGANYWEGVLTYSYTVPARELEVGEHRKKFAEESEADTWARALRDTVVDVRVDPEDPKRSIWQEGPIAGIPNMQRHSGVSPGALEAPSWGMRELAATAVFLLAAAGTVSALWIQLTCIFGKNAILVQQNGLMFFGMHTGAILCGIASSLLQKRRGSPWRSWNLSADASSAPRVVKVVGAYSAMVFLYGWVRLSANAEKPKESGLTLLMFSAVWLLFYLTSALTCWPVLQEGTTLADNM